LRRPGVADRALTPDTDRLGGIRLSWSGSSLATVGYREFSPPAALRELVECAWVVDGAPDPVRVLPDGCMDLIRMNDRIVAAGPDTTASISPRDGEPFVGLRFHPGVLPRLLGVPASDLRNERVPLCDARTVFPKRGSLTELATALASEEPRTETAPWSLPLLGHVTGRLAAGSAVADVARQVGWSARTLQRQCTSVYGYGPATLRRILRFRRAVRLLSDGLPSIEVAARAGYADQPHLHREVRSLAGVPLASLRQESSSANRSTQLPSGSATVA
jgi:AraC-like DNA-binding protein